MGNSDKFLAIYKDYEQELRDMGLDPKMYGDAETDTRLQDRLRVCRLIRNYLSHNADPGFVEPTDKMIKFLQAEVDKLKAGGDPVKKHLKKPEACMLDHRAKMSDALAMFQKLKCFGLLYRQESGGWSMLSVFDTIGVKPACKLELLKMKTVKPKFVGPLERFSSLDMDAVWICTDDGTPNGKILGRVWTRDGGGIC